MAGSPPGEARRVTGSAEALERIDRVLAQRPDKDDHALSDATILLVALRDGLIGQRRAGTLDVAGQRRLDHVNAVITVVLGIHFPLGDVPWHELEKAREWLADITGADEPAL